MIRLQPLAEYYSSLMSADFDYVSADDFSAYCKGRDEVARLKAQADASEQHKALFDAFARHWDQKARWIYNRSVVVPPLPPCPVEEAA